MPGHAQAAGDTDAGVLDALMSPLDAVRADIAYIVGQLNLETAEDYWLDLIGAEYDEPRNGLSDDDYRAQIVGEIAVRRSTGRFEDVVLVVDNVLGLGGESSVTHVQDAYPAKVDVHRSGIAIPEAAALARARVKIQRALAAGVGLRTLTVAEADGFGFEDDSAALGFDEGVWTELVP